MKIEVSDTLLRVKFDLIDGPATDFDLSRTVEGIFRNTTTWIDEQIGNISIKSFNTENADQTNTRLKITSGNPEYIAWCIKNIDSFYLDPNVIDEIQSLTVYRILGIDVDRKIENIYEYRPKIKHEIFSFGENAIKKNRENYETGSHSIRSNHYYDDNNELYWEDEDYSYCDACQQAPCMCSDSDPG